MGGSLKKTTTALVLIVVAVSIGVIRGNTRRPRIASPPTLTATTSADVEKIAVHVAGWVVSPGVVELPEGSLVADAVEAAGGMRSGAVADGVNLAAELAPGQQVLIPGPGHAPSNPGVQEPGILQLNHASASDLETLPGVGPVLAGRIVSYREENGPFQVVEDLLEVPGIGEAKLDSIRDLVQP